MYQNKCSIGLCECGFFKTFCEYPSVIGQAELAVNQGEYASPGPRILLEIVHLSSSFSVSVGGEFYSTYGRSRFQCSWNTDPFRCLLCCSQDF